MHFLICTLWTASQAYLPQTQQWGGASPDTILGKFWTYFLVRRETQYRKVEGQEELAKNTLLQFPSIEYTAILPEGSHTWKSELYHEAIFCFLLHSFPKRKFEVPCRTQKARAICLCVQLVVYIGKLKFCEQPHTFYPLCEKNHF